MAEADPKPPNPIVVLNSYLHDRVDSLRSALPPHMKPERFISAVMTAVQLNPDLLECNRRSLWIACMRCAQDGLLPDGTEAAIVPYKKNASYVPMYQGLLKKFRNSGQFKWVTAGIAYEGEEYEHWIDENGEHFKHVPSNDSPDRKIKRVYALATTKDGGFFVTDMSQADIAKRRGVSRASRDDAPWKVWPDEMMKKTALKNLSKVLPKSSDIDLFLQRDEQESLGVQTTDAISDQRGAAFGDVLDHFAEGDTSDKQAESKSAEAPTPAAGEATGVSGVAAAKPEASGADQPSQSSQTAAAASAPTNPSLDTFAEQTRQAVDPSEVARRRGREGFRAGKKRREVPEEYRAAGSGALALEWTAGWDAEQAEEHSKTAAR
jgi:recombination protein RecT